MKNIFSLTGTLVLLVPVFLLAGCTTTGETVEEDDALPQPREVNLADYEDFDASPYREEAPQADEDITHDVPEELMTGRSGAGELVTMQGYRIQVFSTLEKGQAEDHRQKMASWWQQQFQEGEGTSSDSPVVIRYKQPYYRVRLGNFTSRSAAERVLSSVKEQYDSAFIVPDEVTVRR